MGLHYPNIQDKSIPPGKWWRIVEILSNCNNKKKTTYSNGKILNHPIDKAHVQKLNKYFANFIDNELTLDYLHKDQGCPISLTK